MKKIIISLAAFSLVLSACGGSTENNETANADSQATEQTNEVKPEKRKTGKKLRNQSDSISYAIGADLGYALQQMQESFGDDLNMNYVIAGLKEARADKATLAASELQSTIQNYFMFVVPAKQLEAGNKFLAKVEKDNANIQKTESGLLYEIIEPGSDVKATKLQDKVKVNYVGTLKDGKEFDSSYKRGEPATFGLDQVIKGWGEGLQLIGEGGKIKLWIPADLGYGQYAPQNIGPNQPLVFEVELLEVIPTEVTE